MVTLKLIAVLSAVIATATSASPTTESPCIDDNCKNFTFYLGPRWGSKTLRLPVPKQPDEKFSSEEGVGSSESQDETRPFHWIVNFTRGSKTLRLPVPKQSDEKFSSEEEVGSSESQGEIRPFNRVMNFTSGKSGEQIWRTDFQQQEFDSASHPDKIFFPKRRPVPEDDSLKVDFMDVDEFRFRIGSDDSSKTSPKTPSWIAIEDVDQLFDSKTLNLTGFGLTGDQAKQALYNLSSDSRSQLRSLYLSHNQIRSLPVLCFTVEMEYELEELWLDHNPIDYLNSYTRFELSRLNSLKKLSLAHTGLRYLESLYIPSLVSLDLSGNTISNYYYKMLDGLVNLESLNISNNNLHNGFPISPSALTRLRVLDLSDNRLTNLDDLSLNKMEQLKELHLRNNMIKFSYEIESVPYDVSMYLAGNPWECSCPLIQAVNGDLKWWFKIVDKDEMRCTNENIKVPWPVTSLREQDVAVGCPRKNWLKAVQTKLNEWIRWIKDHTRFLTRHYDILWWALILLVIVAVVYIVRQHRAKPSTPPTIPYHILDDKHVI